MAAALFRPLTSQWGMRKRTSDGGSMKNLAAKFIKPNDRLSSFERLEIYNRCEKVNLAIHRHGNVLYYKRLEAAAFALLTALRRGDSLEEACQAAIDTGSDRDNSDTDWPEKIRGWFANWSSLGWLVPAR